MSRASWGRGGRDMGRGDISRPGAHLRDRIAGGQVRFAEGFARRPGRPGGDGPEDLCRGRLHGSIRLGQRLTRSTGTGARREIGAKRLGAHRPQAF